MNEKKIIKKILNRLQKEIVYENDYSIQFEGDSYEDIVIEFDENGLVTGIY